MIDEKGRCCGRKPLVYKRHPAHRFCVRCDRAYDLDEPEQVENWAWKKDATGTFVTTLSGKSRPRAAVGTHKEEK